VASARVPKKNQATPDGQCVSEPTSVSPEANRYRIERLERDVHEIQVKLDDYGALKQTVVSLARSVETLAGEFSGLRKALYTTAISVSGSMLLFVVAVLVAILQ
jgi:hypothetical protein